MSILWITGNSKSGKSTLARRLKKDEIILDGDEMRTLWPDLGFSEEDRRENNLRIAKLAKILDRQDFNVIVATICPFKNLRQEIQKMTGCRFIYLEGGIERDYEYEK